MHLIQDATQVAVEEFCLAVVAQLILADAAADQAFLTKSRIDWPRLVAAADADAASRLQNHAVVMQHRLAAEAQAFWITSKVVCHRSAAEAVAVVQLQQQTAAVTLLQ